MQIFKRIKKNYDTKTPQIKSDPYAEVTYNLR